MILLDLLRQVLMAYAEQHHPEVLDPAQHAWAEVHQGDEMWMENLTIVEFNHWLQGWWVLDNSQRPAWNWWFCVFTEDPAPHLAAGGDLSEFWHCNLDAPLPTAELSGWPSHAPATV